MAQGFSSDADLLEQTWGTLERLADEAAQCARQKTEPREFYQQLLGRCVSALAAEGAAVWSGREGGWQLDQQVSMAREDFASALLEPAHRELLGSVARDGQARAVLPGGLTAGSRQAGNPTDWMLLLCPVVVDDSTVGVIEVFQRPTADADLQRAYVNLLTVLGESAADFHRNFELRDLRARRLAWEQSQQFTRRVHRCRGTQQTAYTIANEGRSLLACDRLSVVLCRGRRGVLLAVSGVERIQRRSITVRCLEQLSALVAAMREPLRYDGADAELPPQIERLFQAYVEECDVRSVILQPLTGMEEGDPDEPAGDRPLPIGVLVLEQFDAETDELRAGLLGTVSAHSEIALRNAQRRRGSFGRAADWFGQRGRWFKAALGAALVIVLVSAAALIPADFTIQGRGQLVPETRHDVFAIRDGEIQQLMVEHDDMVEQGQVLAKLTSADLDLELKRLSGELQTTQQKLLAARAERGRLSAPTAEDRRAGASWSALEKELQKQAESLGDQLQLVQAESERLTVRSPIRGRIQTWDVQRLLEARPVVQGQVLMTVADVDGPWVVELEIPDHHISHVSAARDEQDAPLPVTFVLKTAPEAKYTGVVQRVGMTTINDEGAPPHIKAVVAVEREQIPLLRSGASVVARIHCGRRSLGYVWLHDLIDAVRTWLFF